MLIEVSHHKHIDQIHHRIKFSGKLPTSVCAELPFTCQALSKDQLQIYQFDSVWNLNHKESLRTTQTWSESESSTLRLLLMFCCRIKQSHFETSVTRVGNSSNISTSPDYRFL